MLQNATPLRKSAPRPPNISDEHVSCIAPATENASLQILFKCPTPAIVFGNATKHYKTLTFCTSCSFLTRCTIPCACHAKPHLNLQKWSEADVFVFFFMPSSWKVLECPPGDNTEGSRMKKNHCSTSGPVSIGSFYNSI